MARLVCIRHGHLLVVEHLLLRMLETGVIGSRLERRHRYIHVLSFLLLHTVIFASLGVIALRHHIVSIEVIANVYSAAVGIRVCVRLLRPDLWIRLRLVLLLLATTPAAVIGVIRSLVILLLIVTLLSLRLVLLLLILILLWPSTLSVLLLFGRHLLLHVLLLLTAVVRPIARVRWELLLLPT